MTIHRPDMRDLLCPEECARGLIGHLPLRAMHVAAWVGRNGSRTLVRLVCREYVALIGP
jgi:hypothetical protein